VESHHFDVDPYPDPDSPFDEDPDPNPACHFDAGTDPTFQFDGDPCGSGSTTLVFCYKVGFSNLIHIRKDYCMNTPSNTAMTRCIITIYAPVIYTRPCIMFWRRGYTLRGLPANDSVWWCCSIFAASNDMCNMCVYVVVWRGS
jgi:hypothetical protein